MNNRLYALVVADGWVVDDVGDSEQRLRGWVVDAPFMEERQGDVQKDGELGLPSQYRRNG